MYTMLLTILSHSENVHSVFIQFHFTSFIFFSFLIIKNYLKIDKIISKLIRTILNTNLVESVQTSLKREPRMTTPFNGLRNGP